MNNIIFKAILIFGFQLFLCFKNFRFLKYSIVLIIGVLFIYGILSCLGAFGEDGWSRMSGVTIIIIALFYLIVDYIAWKIYKMIKKYM